MQFLGPNDNGEFECFQNAGQDNILHESQQTVGVVRFISSRSGYIVSFFDRFFVGKVIKDFGPLEERSFGVGKFRKSVILAEKGGELRFAMKSSAVAFFGASVSYIDIRIDALPKLRQCIDEAERIAVARPQTPT